MPGNGTNTFLPLAEGLRPPTHAVFADWGGRICAAQRCATQFVANIDQRRAVKAPMKILPYSARSSVLQFNFVIVVCYQKSKTFGLLSVTGKGPAKHAQFWFSINPQFIVGCQFIAL